ncbi:MAG: two-component system, chemotaxis family, CheB/CheR fusion protein [Phormidesmis priestleyi Ana]|uniref:histidine kinase n=1 Tax=Phormidesmis priestleyi Ana TaxID=1666911 RepID=A0A0P8BU96_9CYAN|nr:MAG: two-component system, chemotaxis family, CheB/CheR fusion protein [Phormidesmis priestleyi Ana]
MAFNPSSAQASAESPSTKSSSELIDSKSPNLVDAPFPVVGVAASAGGLEAFTQLLSYLPIDTGMAFVLIQHLAPDHESLLAEILTRATQMPVCDAQQGIEVAPNHVYVIPPNTKMIVDKGALQLSPRKKVAGKYMPGDAFFTSLAADCGHKAIAVVLSGGDGDGSLGLKAIKAAGGVTFAQCKETAQYDSMPNTAVATGNVDFVLPPAKIAEALADLSCHPMLAHPIPPCLVEPLPIAEEAITNPSQGIATIFALLRSATGVDFSGYKTNTLDRRIGRRMLLYKLENVADYAAYLQAHPEEIKALYEEILIHVTHFFRDIKAFDLLKSRVFPTITQNKSADTPIRIWVAGCSTGEEVYSIAICLLEFLSDKSAPPPIQIFATDISEQAIDTARAGIYAVNQMVEVSSERRRRFFHTLEGNRHQINKAVRELCVFARQDLGSDPPFSNLDLISCRNVMIYLGESLQKRLIPIFHYSLNTSGFLLLGTSESVGRSSDLFKLVEKKYRVYTKQPKATRPTFSFSPSRYPVAKTSNYQPVQDHPQGFDLPQQIDQLIANHYAPAAVVIDAKMQVMQLRGDIDLYLRLVSGVANFSLFNLVRVGLLIELRAAIYQAQRENMPVTKSGLCLEERGLSRTVTLQVIPFRVPTADEHRFLVLFEEAVAMASSARPVDPQSSSEDLAQDNARLKRELAASIQDRAATQEYLQTVIQDQEQVTQELKVANEEILSSNEELQSTNEELETAKEEIQSTNEELQTTNDELRSRNAAMHQINNDLTNLLAGINIPILMLTQDLRIRWFTPTAQRLFNFIATDAGRPLSDIRDHLNIPNLESLMLEVLETLSVKELEVQTQEGHWYTLRIRPYRTAENQIDGVVLVLLDIDALKRSAVTIEAARNYAEAIVETVQVPLIVLESDFRVNKANLSFYETFEVSSAEMARSLFFHLGNGQWNIPGLQALLENVFENGTVVLNYEVEHFFEHIGQKTMLLNALRIVEPGVAQRVLLAIEDISDRKHFEETRSQLLSQEQLARQEAESANRAKDEFLSNMSHELRNPLTVMLGWARLLRTQQLDEVNVVIAIESIERSAQAQSHLIEDMLDVSRIISGKLNLDIHAFDLNLVIKAAMQSVQLAAEAKSIQMVSPTTSVMVTGDGDRLQQVLWNLLSNAVKFTPTGGQVSITVTALQTDAEIQVSDTGKGIQADQLPYIFERFRQGDSSSSKASQGLGLGLSIVRHVIELHGGTVRAESPGEGQGTTMIVRLPLQSASLEIMPLSDLELDGEDVSRASVDQTNLSLKGLHILAVDDNLDSLAMMKHMLEDLGAQVAAVASAKEVMSALKASPDQYDILLSDIGMPDEDGFSLIRQVRALEANKGGQIPAASVTAYVSDKERQKALAAGFQAHIQKPINLDQMISAIINLTR